MDFGKRELKVGLKDKGRFDAAQLLAALKAEGFPGAKVTDGPS